MTKLDGAAPGTLATVELEGAMDERTEEAPTYCGVSSLRTQPVLAVRAAGQETCLKSTLLAVSNRGHQTKSTSAASSPGVVGALEPVVAEVAARLECTGERAASIRFNTTILLAPARRRRTPLVPTRIKGTHTAAGELRLRLE